jgi:hypothetical protein
MLGPSKARDLDRPIVVSLDQLVPTDHLYRHLERKLDLSFVRDWVRTTTPHTGVPLSTQLSSSSSSSFCTWRDCALSDSSCALLLIA